MKRFRSGIPDNRLNFHDTAADRYVYSYEFVGRELETKTLYQVNGFKAAAENVFVRLNQAKMVQSALRKLRAAARGVGRNAVSALERERERNPYLTLIEQSGLGTVGPAEELPKLDEAISTLETAIKRGRIDSKKAEATLLGTASAMRRWMEPLVASDEGTTAMAIAAMRAEVSAGGGVAVGGGIDEATPVITALVPAEAAAGASIQVVGAAFGNADPNSTLVIGTITATVVSWAPTRIVAVVPPLPPGAAPVVVKTAKGSSAAIVLNVTGTVSVGTLPGTSEGSNPTGDADLQALLALLRSPIGYLFADRTRIRPAGFGIGEHVHTLGLAPGEEVVLEEKTWTKRDVSLEELLEEERQLDIELATAYSTELSEALTREREVKTHAGLENTLTAGAKATVPIYGVPVEFSATNSLTFTANLDTADRLSRNETSKRTFQRSSKVASKARAMHKTTFKVSTETGFESTSKRTIRNPNRDAALDVHLFKVMQSLEVEQQRYGVRLCWAPFVKDPGFAARERARLAADALMKQAEAELDLPPKPSEPALPPTQAERRASPIRNLDPYFGLWNDMRVDVRCEIELGDRRWDGGPVDVIFSFTGKRSAGAYIVGSPWLNGTKLYATVHIGIDWTLSEACGNAKVQIAANTYSVATKDQEEALKKFRDDTAAWEKEIEKRKREARRVAGLEAESERDVYFDLDPLTELLAAVVRSHFKPAVRDDFYEVELWHQVFDFEQAGYSLYPGTWATTELPVPERAPSHFVNASWGRLYLPIRPGYELLALRFVYGGVIDQPLSQRHENAFTAIIKELKEYRRNRFGDVDELGLDANSRKIREKVDVLARWKETLPTDGTHAELTLSETTGLSEFAETALTDEGKLRAAIVRERGEDADLKERAAELMTETTANVTVSTNGEGG